MVASGKCNLKSYKKFRYRFYSGLRKNAQEGGGGAIRNPKIIVALGKPLKGGGVQFEILKMCAPPPPPPNLKTWIRHCKLLSLKSKMKIKLLCFLLITSDSYCIFQEFLLPIYFVMLLGIIRLSVSPKKEPEIANFPEHLLQTVSIVPDSDLFVTPDSPLTRSIIQNVTAELPNTFNATSFFDSQEELEEFYKDHAEAHTHYVIGVDFGDVGAMGAEYTLRFSSYSVPSSHIDSLFGSQGYYIIFVLYVTNFSSLFNDNLFDSTFKIKGGKSKFLWI